MNCTEVLEQLGDYLDEEARQELCREIETHMKRCPNCQFYVDTVKKTIFLYQADRNVELPTTVSQRLGAVMAREYAQRSTDLSPSD